MSLDRPKIMTGPLVRWTIGLFIMLAMLGCTKPTPARRSPSSDADPDRADRALREAQAIEQNIHQAEQDAAKRQGLLAPRSK
jgi:hypothetical protein